LGGVKTTWVCYLSTANDSNGEDGMGNYYVDKNIGHNGEHEVHEAGCLHMPDINDKEYLGSFPNCADAVIKAKKTYPAADGCGHCSNECYPK
jgi:hypothetical protein